MFCEMFSFRSNYFSFILKSSDIELCLKEWVLSVGCCSGSGGLLQFYLFQISQNCIHLFVTIKANKNVLYIILEV